MRARLLKDARVQHKAGEIVEISPAQFNVLASFGAAVAVVEKPVKAETPKKGTKKK